MNRKRGNILSLILSLVLSCAIIPIGIMKDWGIMEYLLCCATLFISGLIVGWNNEAAFRIKGGADYHLGYNTIGFFCFVFGGQGLGECWGEALLLKCLGAVLVITGAIFIRRACSTRSDTKE